MLTKHFRPELFDDSVKCDKNLHQSLYRQCRHGSFVSNGKRPHYRYYQVSDTLVSPYINIRHNVLDCDRFDKRHCQRLIHGYI